MSYNKPPMPSSDSGRGKSAEQEKKAYALDDVANYFDDKSGKALEQYKAEKDPKERQSIFNARQQFKDFEFKIQNADYAEPEDFEGILRDLEDHLGSFTGVEYSPKTGEYRGLADTRSIEERNKIREFVDIINKKRYPGAEMQEINVQEAEIQLSKFANEIITGADGDRDTVIYCQKVLEDFKSGDYKLPLEFIESNIEGLIFRNENIKDENYLQKMQVLRGCREFFRKKMRVQEKLQANTEQKKERLAQINSELESFNNHAKNREEERQIGNERGKLYQKTLDELEKTLGPLGAGSKKMIHKKLIDDSIEHAQIENKRFNELQKEKALLEGEKS